MKYSFLYPRLVELNILKERVQETGGSFFDNGTGDFKD